jgi:hypothetical protein
MIARSLEGGDDFVQLEMNRARLLVLRALDQNTIRNVTMVVPVLITSCQVSE